MALSHKVHRAAPATLAAVTTEVVAGWADLLEGEEIAYAGIEAARDGRSEPLPDDLDPLVASALVANGVTSLYRHQAETWEAARRSENVVVTTGTASGKSLAFNLPVLDAIVREPKTRALYLYPTKALAQDQARALSELRLKGLKPAIYDGDTWGEQRWQIRKLVEPDPHEPRHAPRRRPSAPRPLGRCPAQPALRRRRRGARLPRGVRIARRQRSAPTAPPRADLRRRPPVPARVGDDRERGRARRSAHRRAGLRGRERHVAESRARGRHLEPAAPRSGARPACERARGRFSAHVATRLTRPEDDLLREEPQGGRADPPVHGRAGRPRDGEPSRPLSSGLHPRAAS